MSAVVGKIVFCKNDKPISKGLGCSKGQHLFVKGGSQCFCGEKKIEEKMVSLTEVEITHLLSLMHDAKVEGSYYGNKEQYWKRHDRIEEKLKNG